MKISKIMTDKSEIISEYIPQDEIKNQEFKKIFHLSKMRIKLKQ